MDTSIENFNIIKDLYLTFIHSNGIVNVKDASCKRNAALQRSLDYDWRKDERNEQKRPCGNCTWRRYA